MSEPSEQGLELRELAADSLERWNAFIQACPEATFFHRAEWQAVIPKTFGHDAYFIYAERSGRIEGVLPLVHVRSRLFGSNLLSLPFCVCAGVAAVTDEARRALEGAACDLALALKVGALEMRNRVRTRDDWPVKDLYFTFSRTIEADPDANLQAIPRKQRAMVRKGIKAGLQSEGTDDVDRFYPIYAESVRNLGTPVFARKYFRLLKEAFGDDCRVLVVTHGGRDIAAVMSFYFRNQVLPYYGGSLPVAREVKGNDFMYWALMSRSAEEGIRVFDYGRSKRGTGAFSFKKNWGFEPRPLYYEYFLVKDDRLPDVNPLNPKYERLIRLWRRLPLPIANALGPWIARDLG
ncbi:MAG: FemAB family PEP-CTERM system-associated protein [Chromatiales bacterium]|jgi:FemAB-related protein (PEP-CTERM system-associated)